MSVTSLRYILEERSPIRDVDFGPERFVRTRSDRFHRVDGGSSCYPCRFESVQMGRVTDTCIGIEQRG